MLRALIVAVLAATSCLVAGPARADGPGGWSDVQCATGREPVCDVAAGTTGPRPSSVPTARRVVDSDAEAVCRDVSGQRAPCSDPDLGWLGEGGCYYRSVAVNVPRRAAPGARGPGAWYAVTCPGTPIAPGLVWLPNEPAADGGLQSPAALAQQARNRLRLPAPVLRASPSLQQVVNVPIWLWLAPGVWQTHQAVAAVPGMSVTATATPRQVRWAMGDGSTVLCEGPGTPYRGRLDPAAASPSCGHTYRRSSAAQPHSVYQVQVTISWAIGWTGGGQTGNLPALSTTSTVSWRVAEAQALTVTAGRDTRSVGAQRDV